MLLRVRIRFVCVASCNSCMPIVFRAPAGTPLEEARLAVSDVCHRRVFAQALSHAVCAGLFGKPTACSLRSIFHACKALPRPLLSFFLDYINHYIELNSLNEVNVRKRQFYVLCFQGRPPARVLPERAAAAAANPRAC